MRLYGEVLEGWQTICLAIKRIECSLNLRFPCLARDWQQALNRNKTRPRNAFVRRPTCLDWWSKALQQVPHVEIHVQRIGFHTTKAGVVFRARPLGRAFD